LWRDNQPRERIRKSGLGPGKALGNHKGGANPRGGKAGRSGSDTGILNDFKEGCRIGGRGRQKKVDKGGDVY